MGIDPVALLGPHGAIARHLPGYEVRQEQIQMADAVAKAIESGTHLMVEAGTGVGKSFGYPAPAILAATEPGKKVVVSTRTINLQEQLIHKDLPFLQSVLPQEFDAVLVKGRSNYVSLRRLEAAAARIGSTAGAQESTPLEALRVWSAVTKDGSLSTLSSHPNEVVWDSVQSDSGNCLKQYSDRSARSTFRGATKAGDGDWREPGIRRAR
jgi:ATP-dependent DNA helicase DinG